MPIFLERFVLPVFVAAIVLLALTNPMGFDTTQRITGALALCFAAYFVAHTVHKNSKQSVPAHSASSQPIPTKDNSQPFSPKDNSAQNGQPAKKITPHKIPLVASHSDWLTDTQKGNIESVLKDKIADIAQVRLVCIGQPIPKYADQIQEAFKAATWSMDRLEIASASMNNDFPEQLYVLAPKTDAPAVIAVVQALEAGRLSAPVHPGMPTIGPASLGLPAVTIVIRASKKSSAQIHERQVDALLKIDSKLDDALFYLQRVASVGKFQGEASDKELFERSIRSLADASSEFSKNRLLISETMGQKLDDFFGGMVAAGIDFNLILDPMVNPDMRAQLWDKLRETAYKNLPSVLKAIRDDTRAVING